MQLNYTNYNSRKKFVRKVDRELIVTFKTGELYGKYALKRISPDMVAILRRSKRAYSLLKDGDNLAIAEIPCDVNLVNSIGKHQCNTCKYQFENNPLCSKCKRIRDYSNFGSHSEGIEEYDFIRKGFETFGCKVDAYIVMSCDNYIGMNPSKI